MTCTTDAEVHSRIQIVNSSSSSSRVAVKMVYVSNGQVLDNRTQSPWRLSLLVDLFWGAVEFIGLFFQSLVQPDLTKDGKSGTSRFNDGKGPPGPPGGRRKMGRINHGGGPGAPPMGGGGG